MYILLLVALMNHLPVLSLSIIVHRHTCASLEVSVHLFQIIQSYYILLTIQQKLEFLSLTKGHESFSLLNKISKYNRALCEVKDYKLKP